MIRRIGIIASREFIATAGTKGFLIGLLVLPLLLFVVITIAPKLARGGGPQVSGEVVVIDPTGSVGNALRAALEPSAIEVRRTEFARRRALADGPGRGVASLPPIPALTLVERPASTDLSKEKAELIQRGDIEPRRLAVVVIHPDALKRDPSKPDYGTYDLFAAKRLNDATESTLHASLQAALSAVRLQGGGLESKEIAAQTFVPQPQTIVVTEAGERIASRWVTRMLPFACGLLLFMGIITSGQALLTSTIEEKSSRVVEVLLAAAAPIELMWGKLLGQLAVGLLMVGVYVALSVASLLQLSMFGLLDPSLVLWLLVFYLLSFLVFGALMMAIGAAVNQIADAQSLMGPVMLLMLLPYMLTPMIGQSPNSTLSVALSFIPPFNNFVMLARLASDTPPPLWQALLTLLVSVASAAMVVWFAAKVFRIGLLMHGKPPNFRTLLRWARIA